MCQIYVTTTFTDPKYDKDDRVHNDIYEDNNEMNVEQLILAMEPFIVPSHIIRSKKDYLIKCLRDKDYYYYYKTIKKMAKNAMKELYQ